MCSSTIPTPPTTTATTPTPRAAATPPLTVIIAPTLHQPLYRLRS